MYTAQKNLPFKEITLKSFPSIVQLQTTSVCNGSCVMCPYPLVTHNIKHGVMSQILFDKIIDECSKYEVKEFKPFLMNEPLIDKRLPDLISYAKKKMPNTRIGFSTNGLLMKGDMIRRIVDSGVDEVWFNFAGNTEKTYNNVLKGLNFQIVRKNIIDFARCVEKYGKNISVNISMVEVKECLPEIQDSVDFWKEYNVSVRPIPFNNRGGNSMEDGIKVLENPLSKRACDKAIIKICILYDGRVILCPSDWQRKHVIGNVSKDNIFRVWNSEIRQNYITNILQSNYEPIDICRSCDYPVIYKE